MVTFSRTFCISLPRGTGIRDLGIAPEVGCSLVGLRACICSLVLFFAGSTVGAGFETCELILFFSLFEADDLFLRGERSESCRACGGA
jgi:hypothetical protein